jgi:hypothetical protein
MSLPIQTKKGHNLINFPVKKGILSNLLYLIGYEIGLKIS